MLAQQDGLGGPNPGVMYLRAAAPGGPTAWALAEAVGRNVRWREAPTVLAQLNSTMTSCYHQSSLTDAVWSALAGRPLFARCLAHRQLDQTWSSREDGLKAFEEANSKLVSAALWPKAFDTDRHGPRCHLSFLGRAGLLSSEGQLRAPHAGGAWPAELGGRALGGGLGPVAAAFIEMLRGPGTPMWPDPEHPSPAAAAAAAAVPAERFAFLSRHLACDWAGCGSLGMYAPALRPNGQEPCVVVGHISASPDKALGRRFQLLHNAAFNPELAAALHGPGGRFLAAATGHHTGHTGAGVRASGGGRGAAQQVPLPKLLALSPAALSPGPAAPASASPAGHPLVLASKEAYVGLVEALSGVAVATGRTLALPRLSCDFPWMHRTDGGGPAFNGSHYVPWTYLRGEAFAPFGASLRALSCEWYAWLQHGCLHGPVHVERRHGHRGSQQPAPRMLLSAEMDHYLSLLPPEDRVPVPPASAPAPGNASAASLIRLADLASTAADAFAAPLVAGPDGVYNVTMAQLAAALGRVAPSRPIVWLERPMRVTDLPQHLAAAHQQWVNHCCGLSWPRSLNHICFTNL